VADRWAECRRIEGEIAGRITECDRLLLRPWSWRRRARLRRELPGLLADLDAAIDEAAAQRPRRSREDILSRGAIRYEAS
jgi:hypothetical protein